MLTVSKLTPAIGAEIGGIDLSQPLRPEDADRLYDILLDRLVIFFRGQQVSPAAHMALAESFGTVDAPHPIYPHVAGFPSMVCLDTSDDNPPDTNVWHADLTFKDSPPFASILRAQHLPETGGDTIWANMYAVYDALPRGLKADLEDLSAVHDMGDFRNDFAAGPEGSAAKLTAAMQRMGCAVKPVVATSPATGRPYLNVNEGFTMHVCGLSRTESDQLLQCLFKWVNRPEFQVRFRWSPGAMAMWDNRVTQHYAVADYLPARRVMHRVTVVDDRRLGAGAAA